MAVPDSVVELKSVSRIGALNKKNHSYSVNVLSRIIEHSPLLNEWVKKRKDNVIACKANRKIASQKISGNLEFTTEINGNHLYLYIKPPKCPHAYGIQFAVPSALSVNAVWKEVDNAVRSDFSTNQKLKEAKMSHKEEGDDVSGPSSGRGKRVKRVLKRSTVNPRKSEKAGESNSLEESSNKSQQVSYVQEVDQPSEKLRMIHSSHIVPQKDSVTKDRIAMHLASSDQSRKESSAPISKTPHKSQDKKQALEVLRTVIGESEDRIKSLQEEISKEEDQLAQLQAVEKISKVGDPTLLRIIRSIVGK